MEDIVRDGIVLCIYGLVIADSERPVVVRTMKRVPYTIQRLHQ